MLNLGRLYELGYGVEKNLYEAKKLYAKAKHWGTLLMNSNNFLGYDTDYNSRGTPFRCYGDETPEYLNWFLLAAEQGNPKAQYWMGYGLLIIRFAEYEVAEPFELSGEKKKECGSFKAEMMLRVQRASVWIKRAAEQGLPKAQILLGDLYMGGRRAPFALRV